MTKANWFKHARRVSMVGLASIMLAACGLTPEQDRAAIEEGILTTPGGQELWQTIKREYPEDFGNLIDRLQALDFSQRRDDSVSEEIGKVWLQEFFGKIAPDSVKAPAEQLLQWSASEQELYAVLQRSSVNDCAAMTMGQWIFVDESNTLVTGAIARRNAAMVRSAAAGRDNPQQYAEPDDADFGRLGDSIADTGIDPDLQAALGSDAAMAALGPAEQCEIGVAVYSGLAALPDDVEPELAAYMLSPE
ncbi:hypothetical protein [uncultured Erythrobacter sp.]|uniref:hypothetical protein n=1 Tax=uncultured Erythrobacter sp. TaxID=263913 RepID=UPI00262FCE52|nr:hypothetical protein [uncultured Erythrobacter sp.]